MFFADEDLGGHQAKKRRLVYHIDDIGIVGVNIAATGFTQGNKLYVPGFEHFAGQIDATTPAATTLAVRIIPGLEGNIFFADSMFVVATITTVAIGARRRYAFYWGTGRGLLTAVAPGAGSNYCVSSVFKFQVNNTGANVANSVSIVQLECF